MEPRHDVVIAGAGPAGAQCARDLAARDYDVVVLETETEEAFPSTSNKSTAGTFPRMTGAFGVPGEVVMNYTDAVVLESPSSYFDIEQPGAVLDFAAFKQWLVAAGRENGARYRFDARVNAPITDDDGDIIGVQFNGDEELYADIVVDATGPAAPLAKAVGLSDLRRENHAIGIEWEFEGVQADHPDFADLTDAMMLRLDHDIAPGGYSWIFHTGEDRAKVGLCYIQNDRHQEYARDDFSIDDYLDHWLQSDPRLQDAERIAGEQHRGSAHIQLPGRMSADSFMAIGDTVPSVDPLWGEGIHKCMESGRAAAITADHALTGTVDTTAEELSLYDDLWHDRVAPNVENRLWMTELMYLASNERYDRFMRDLRRLPTETLAKANNGSKRAILRLLHLRDLPMLAKFVRERMGWGTGSRFQRPSA